VVDGAVVAAVKKALRDARSPDDELAREARAWLIDVDELVRPLPLPLTSRTERALRGRRATAARGLVVSHELDPALALSFAVWPTLKVLEAEDELAA
jgi:hypothetical protein